MSDRARRMLFFAPLALVGMALFIFVGGEIVLHLWNWLLPPLFGWRELTFWQALGMLVLCRILFGGSGWSRPGCGSRMRGRMAQRWGKMAPGERARARQGW